MIFDAESTVLQRNKYHSSSVNLHIMIMSFYFRGCNPLFVIGKCTDIDVTIVKAHPLQLKLILITFPQNQSQLTELTSELSTQLLGCV